MLEKMGREMVKVTGKESKKERKVECLLDGKK